MHPELVSPARSGRPDHPPPPGAAGGPPPAGRSGAPARQPFLTDLTDTQWSVLRAKVFTGPDAPADLREVVNALLYREQAVCPWRLIPLGFPPAARLRQSWEAWRADGTWAAVRGVVEQYPHARVLHGFSHWAKLRRALTRRFRRLPGGGMVVAAGRFIRHLKAAGRLLARTRRAVARNVRRLPGGGALLFPGRAVIQTAQFVISRFAVHAKCPGWYRRAMHHFFAKEFEEAAEYYTKVIELDPFAAPSYLHRAICRYRLRRYTAAIADGLVALVIPVLTPDERITLYYLLSEATTLAGDPARGVEYGYHARWLQLQGPNPDPDMDEGPTVGPDTFEILADAHNDLAELAINTNTDFETATLLYSSAEALREQYVRWLGEVTPRTLFLPEDWVRNIGHIALLDFWVKMKHLGWGDWDRMVLLAPPRQTANLAYLRYYRKYFHVVHSDPVSAGMRHFATSLGRRLACLLHLPDNTTPYLPEGIGVIQKEWERQGRTPLLKLTPGDEAFGRAQLRAMGVPPGAWYVCFHARSAGFYREGKILHQAHRNADIRTYIPAMREVVRRGGWVIRLGDPSMDPLPRRLPGVIDYARSRHKSARMDVFLGATARFFVGVTSGLCHLPTTFGVPCVLTNWVSNSLPVYSRHDLFIPKMLRRESDDSRLTFDEWLSRPVRDSSYSGEGLIRAGYEVVDNTPEELTEVVAEMMDLLDGKDIDTPLTRQQAAAFGELAAAHGVRGFSRIAPSFLRRYADLLPPLPAAHRAA